MMVMLAGGPRDGDIVEVGDGYRTIKVAVARPYPDFGMDIHEYELVRNYGTLGRRQIAAAKYVGMRVEPQVLIQPERNTDGQQKQETSTAVVSASGGGGGGNGGAGRAVYVSGTGGGAGNRSDAAGPDGSRYKCGRPRGGTGRDTGRAQSRDEADRGTNE